MAQLNHFDKDGKAIMADVSEKQPTLRRASAKGRITLCSEAYSAVISGTAKKGDVLGVARIAGIMAVKKTPDIIPLCHPLEITSVSVEFNLYPETFQIEAVCSVSNTGRTGVEMEALCGTSAALLTIYDMLKAIDKGMVISSLHLMHKSGGKSGTFIFPEENGND